MVSADLASFLESGVAILVGTRDARLFPECTRGIGARVEAGGEELTIFLPDAIAARTLANLEENGRVAVGFSRSQDHRSFQVKGHVVALAPARDSDRADVERYRCAWAAELAAVGLPPRITLRMAHWPAHAVRLRIESVFVQTPGPGAGAPLGPPGGMP
jgi:predicted pyridoxine 5'-phosphate oxidase superfamily flavin-nucleotide-binding protein